MSSSFLLFVALLLQYAQCDVKITEIMYSPRLLDGVLEYIELFNDGERLALDGYKLKSLFTFAAGTFIERQSYLVVARNRTQFLRCVCRCSACALCVRVCAQQRSQLLRERCADARRRRHDAVAVKLGVYDLADRQRRQATRNCDVCRSSGRVERGRAERGRANETIDARFSIGVRR